MSYPIHELDAPWQNPASWENIPAVESFVLEGTSSYFLSHPTSCRIARDGNSIVLMMEAKDPAPEKIFMKEKYQGWFMDDSAEIYLTDAHGDLHQLLFNLTGASIYFKNLGFGPDISKGVQITGERLTDGWRAILRLELDAMGLCWNDELKVMIRRNAPRELLTHCIEWGVGAGEKPAARLVPIDVPASSASCAEAEAALNGDYDKWLMNLKSNGTLDSMAKLYSPSGADPLAALRATLGTALPPDKTAAKAELAAFTQELKQYAEGSRLQENMVDFGIHTGTVKMLNGTNLGPQLNNQSNNNFNDKFKALRLSYARLHDAPLTNSGMKLVDTSQIFPLQHLDPAVESNYYFTQTDDYIRNIRDLGTDIVYRLGVSIEHSIRKYFAVAPEDFDHFAEICAGIVRHYNAGWNNGYNWNIKYWEIWNEPDLGPQMWNTSLEEYYRLYVTVAKRLKAEFPDIKVGGPSMVTMGANRLKTFLDYCHEHGADVDFISWHRYTSNPQECLNHPRLAKLIADSSGFPNAEFHLNEWHYFPDSCDWISLRQDPDTRAKVLTSPDGFNGIDSAAYITHLLTRWQDTPMTITNFYMTNGTWGLYDGFGRLYDTYYALLAFAPFADMRSRVAAEAMNNTSILAATDGKDKGIILVTSFKEKNDKIQLRIKNLPAEATLTVKAITPEHTLDEVPFTFDDGILTLNKHASSAVFQILVN